MCLMVQDLNNLDTEYLLTFLRALMTWLRRRKDSTGNPFRRLSLVIQYRANIVCTAPYFKIRRFCGS